MRGRIVCWLVAVLVSPLALAGEPPAPAKKPAAKEAPKEENLERLDSWAEKMVYHSDTGQFHLTGEVVVIKGNLRVNCDEMIGHVDPKTRQIVRVVAIGNVKMITVQAIEPGRPAPRESDAWRGNCAKADYDLKQDRVTMLSAPGHPRPRLWRAKGYGEADTIIFFPQKGEYELIGDPVIRGEIPTGPTP